MPRGRLFQISCALALLGAAGCGTLVGEGAAHAVASYEMGDPAGVVPAPHTGVYELRRSLDLDALGQFAVREGDPIGFEAPDREHVVAVAGAARQPLDISMLRRGAYWRYVGPVR